MNKKQIIEEGQRKIKIEKYRQDLHYCVFQLLALNVSSAEINEYVSRAIDSFKELLEEYND